MCFYERCVMCDVKDVHTCFYERLNGVRESKGGCMVFDGDNGIKRNMGDKAEECKSLQTTSLNYSNAKSTLLVPLTFSSSRTANMKISILFIFF